MPLAPDLLEAGRSRLRQVFSYLQALNELRNPVVTNIREQPWWLFLSDLPDHPLVRRGWIVESNPEKEGEIDLELDPVTDFVLKVGRPTPPPPCPPPPDSIRPWIRDGWQKLSAVPEHYPTLQVNTNDDIIEESFEASPERLELDRKWIAQRTEWQQRARPTFETMELFDRLYTLHGRLEREGEQFDLVLGDGMLHWNHGDAVIRHPLLLRRIQLHFEPLIPEFRFVETAHGPEFYGAPFRAIPGIRGELIRRIREEVEANSIEPLAGQEAADVLRQVAIGLHERGTYSDGPAEKDSPEFPQIGRQPVIFLRKRTSLAES